MVDDLKDQGEMCVYRGCEEREHLLDITPSNAPVTLRMKKDGVTQQEWDWQAPQPERVLPLDM